MFSKGKGGVDWSADQKSARAVQQRSFVYTLANCLLRKFNQHVSASGDSTTEELCARKAKSSKIWLASHTFLFVFLWWVSQANCLGGDRKWPEIRWNALIETGEDDFFKIPCFLFRLPVRFRLLSRLYSQLADDIYRNKRAFNALEFWFSETFCLMNCVYGKAVQTFATFYVVWI